MSNESIEIRKRYFRRNSLPSGLYDPLNPSVYMCSQEKERALIRWIQWSKFAPLNDKKVLEVGCGTGGNLLQLIRLGFVPENLVGNELLEERARTARHCVPEATQILVGDASDLELAERSFDVVLQSTVFSSILDNNFQQKLAEKIWSLIKPGGGVLWYDFTFNNPKNPDVRGVSIRRVRELFPYGKIKVWRLTLAPPISRLITKIHPSLYTLFNMLPILRTHVLCWIRKV
jgi:SAM-dependent methyltransferase